MKAKAFRFVIALIAALISCLVVFVVLDTILSDSAAEKHITYVIVDSNDFKAVLEAVRNTQENTKTMLECVDNVLATIDNLHNIDTHNIERIGKIEKKLSTLDNLKCFLLAENFEINGKKMRGLSADERINLCQRIFHYLNEMYKDPNDEYGIICSEYWIGDVHIDIEDLDFQKYKE